MLFYAVFLQLFTALTQFSLLFMLSSITNGYAVTSLVHSFQSIPLYGIRIAGSLVVLQRIGQRRGVATEREVVAGVGREHH